MKCPIPSPIRLKDASNGPRECGSSVLKYGWVKEGKF